VGQVSTIGLEIAKHVFQTHVPMQHPGGPPAPAATPGPPPFFAMNSAPVASRSARIAARSSRAGARSSAACIPSITER
jgi:hypothetical protein